MDVLLGGVLVAVALFALCSTVRRWWISHRPVRVHSLNGLERTVESVVELLSEIAEPARSRRPERGVTPPSSRLEPANHEEQSRTHP